MKCYLKISIPSMAQFVRIHLQCRRPWFSPRVRKIPWRRDRLPTPVFLGFPCGSAGTESAFFLRPFLLILSSNSLYQDVLYPGLQKFLNLDNYCSTEIQLRSTFGFRSYQYEKIPQGVSYH